MDFSRVVSRLAGTVRRLPFTLGSVVLMVVLAGVLGTFGTDLQDTSRLELLGYGWPSFADGNWWTVLAAAPLALAGWMYVPVLLSFTALVGLAEYRLGTARAAGLWLTGQTVSVLGAAALVGLTTVIGLDGLGMRTALDVGPSGGAFFAGWIAAGALPHRLLRVLRGGLLAFTLTWVLVVHNLSDLVHLVAVAVAALVAIRFTDARLRPARDQADGADPYLARHLLRTHGGGTLSWMTTWSGVRHFVAPDGDGFVAYRVHAGVALVLGEAIGSPQFRAAAPRLFAAHCHARGLRPAWFAVSPETAVQVGDRHLVVAEDTLLDLPDLEFRGKSWQDVRTARNRAAREGIVSWIGPLLEAPLEVQAQVESLCAAWLASQRTPELGFTLGTTAHAMDPAARVAVALDDRGTVHGVTSWLPQYGPGGEVVGWTMDLMRRGTGFAPVVEFLIAEAAQHFRAEGAQVLSLSGAPLACGPQTAAAAGSGLVQRALLGSAGVLEPLYGFASLHAFKAKFSPRTTPMVLAFERMRDLPRIGVAVALAFLHTPKVPVTAHLGLEPAPQTATQAAPQTEPLNEPALS